MKAVGHRERWHAPAPGRGSGLESLYSPGKQCQLQPLGSHHRGRAPKGKRGRERASKAEAPDTRDSPGPAPNSREKVVRAPHLEKLVGQQ